MVRKMSEHKIRNLCALYGCVIERQKHSAVRYDILTHDGLFVIDWSFKYHSVEWYAQELEAAIRAARKGAIEGKADD